MTPYQLRMAPPLVSFEPIDLDTLNRCLVAWEHKMGPLNRPMNGDECHALLHHGEPLAVIATSTLVRERVARFDRTQAIEVSRLCASRPALCRVVLRLWREFVFPAMGYEWAVSYQDAKAHTGNTYRFDGWERVAYSHSGTDPRSGRKGRDKWIWAYFNPAYAAKEAAS